MTAMIKKITARTVGCSGKVGESFTVIGKLLRAVQATTDRGPYIRFGGVFEAVNDDSGEVFRSASLIVPSVAEELLHSALGTAQAEDEHAAVGIAFRFYTKEDQTAITKYIWAVDQLADPFASDPLEDLRKLLPKPKKAA